MKRLVGTRKVRERFNDWSESTLWRRVNDPKSGFPKPIKINGRNYWDEDVLDVYLAKLAADNAS